MIIMNRNTSPISPFKDYHYEKAQQLTAASQYPEEELNRFKHIYGKLNHLDPQHLELANGSDEWIQKLMIVFGLDGGAMTLKPDFFMYTDYANQLGVDLTYFEADEEFKFDIEALLEEIRRVQPKMFIFSNPQNPTGHQFGADEIQALADVMAEVDGYLVIDEAYIEFGQDYQRPQGDHVIVLRTMSKIYGMAGLRIGIIHATGPSYEKITKINHPYPLNSLVLNAASEFLEDEKERQSFINYQLESKDRLVEVFDQVSDLVQVKPSAGNFIFTYGKRAKDLGQYVKSQGYLPRFYEEDDLKDVVRYSIIALEDYEAFDRVIKAWKEQA